MREFEVQFQPDGLRIAVEQGTLISDAMKSVGMKIQLYQTGLKLDI